MNALPSPIDYQQLAKQIKDWALELGFQQLGITDIELRSAEERLQQWLAQSYQGDMAYLARHGYRRSRPAELVPGTCRVLSVRMQYLPTVVSGLQILQSPEQAFIARYALGRDYHKLIRKRLQQLAQRIYMITTDIQYRVFVDSAPVLEKPLAEKAGLGWIGKHTNLINRQAGSWFFLGEIYTNLPLPIDPPTRQSHCGRCQACLTACPTQAIIAPYQLDARRCISYLTIELQGTIPVALRPFIGNRVFGCDDCQLACPWNRFAQFTQEQDFLPRHGLDTAKLIDLFGWSEDEFLQRMEGSAIRRLGHSRWLRNLAVALGNGKPDPLAIEVLRQQQSHPAELVREHVVWALTQLANKKA